MKEKFPCLNHLRLQPNAAGKIVLACCILHNLEIRGRTSPWNTNDDDDAEIFEDDEFVEDDIEQPHPNAAAVLNNFRHFFSN